MKTSKEEFQEQIINFKEDIIQMVEERFNEDHKLDPVVFGLIFKDGRLGTAMLLGLAELFIDDEGKDTAAAIIKKITKELKLLSVALVSEAWASSEPISSSPSVINTDGEFVEGSLKPKDDQKFIEALVINFETHDQEACRIWEITSDKKLKSITNTQWQPKKPGEGRFKDLVMEDYSDFAQEIKKNLKDNLN